MLAAGDDKAVCELSENELERLCTWLREQGERLKKRELCYTILRTQEGQFKDFCFADITHYGSLMQVSRAESACELLDVF